MQVATRSEADSQQLNQEQVSQDLLAAQQKLSAFEQMQRTLEMQHQQALQDIETKVCIIISAPSLKNIIHVCRTISHHPQWLYHT